jgi:CO/xanthine dehydrogenase Mo-binding subunit
MIDAPASRMSLSEKSVVVDNHRVSLAEIAQAALDTGGGILAHGTFIAEPPAYDASRLEDHLFPVFNSPSFPAHAAEVSVDEGTGEVTVERYVVVQDVGFAVNPTYIEGQIHGGVAQGLGQALMEGIVYDENGFVVNANLTDYKLPTSLDIPEIETILVEQASEAGPYGAKGVGEPPCVMPMATLANAVASACDLRITSVPITPEKVLLALRRKATEDSLTTATPAIRKASC